MPNWKTYDSSVRLLSAILAAHPELKLNYAGMSEAFRVLLVCPAALSLYHHPLRQSSCLPPF